MTRHIVKIPPPKQNFTFLFHFLFQHFQLEKSWSRTSLWKKRDIYRLVYVTSWRHKCVVENIHNTHKLIPGQLSLTIDSRVKLHVSVGRFCMILRVLNAVKIARQLLAASFLKLLWKACVPPPKASWHRSMCLTSDAHKSSADAIHNLYFVVHTHIQVWINRMKW